MDKAMMKKTQYQQPAISVLLLRSIGMLAKSNILDANGNANLNASTMEGGDGSDAARSNAGWDDED